MATNAVRNCSMYRPGYVLRTKRIHISVQHGMGYHNPKSTIPHQTLPPSFLSTTQCPDILQSTTRQHECKFCSCHPLESGHNPRQSEHSKQKLLKLYIRMTVHV